MEEFFMCKLFNNVLFKTLTPIYIISISIQIQLFFTQNNINNGNTIQSSIDFGQKQFNIITQNINKDIQNTIEYNRGFSLVKLNMFNFYIESLSSILKEESLQTILYNKNISTFQLQEYIKKDYGINCYINTHNIETSFLFKINFNTEIPVDLDKIQYNINKYFSYQEIINLTYNNSDILDGYNNYQFITPQTETIDYIEKDRIYCDIIDGIYKNYFNLFNILNDKYYIFIDDNTDKKYIVQFNLIPHSESTKYIYFIFTVSELVIMPNFGIFNDIQLIKVDSELTSGYYTENIDNEYFPNIYFYSILNSIDVDYSINSKQYIKQVLNYDNVVQINGTFRSHFFILILLSIIFIIVVSYLLFNKLITHKLNILYSGIRKYDITRSDNYLDQLIYPKKYKDNIDTLLSGIVGLLKITKKYNSKIIEIDSKFKQITDSLEEFILEIEIDGTIIFNNKQFNVFYNNKRKDIISTHFNIPNIEDINIKDLLSGGNLENFEKILQDYLSGNNSKYETNFNTILSNRDSTNSIIQNCRIVPKYDISTGYINSFILSIIDITLQEKINSNFKTLFSNTNDLILILDEKYKIIDCNKQQENQIISRRNNKSIILKESIFDYFNSDSIYIKSNLEKLTLNNNCVMFDLKYKDEKDGNTFKYFEFNICLVQDDLNKQKNYYFQIQRDVSENKKLNFSIKNSMRNEQIISDISYSFLYQNAYNIKDVIYKVFSKLGNMCNKGRLYLFECDDPTLNNNKYWSNTVEWTDENTTPQIDKLQNLDLSKFKSIWNCIINNKEILYIPDTRQMKNKTDKGFLIEQDIKSLLILFIRNVDGKISQFIGFDDTIMQNNWEKYQFELLKIVKNAAS